MLDWLRRDPLGAFLILAAGTATAFSNVPECVPFGHELGLGVMGVGYSYLAAYIFNWIIVERPRAKALRDVYEAAWWPLSGVARNADNLVEGLEFLADQKEAMPITKVYLQDLLKRIGTGDLLDPPQYKARDLFLAHIEWHRDNYRQLAPILHSIEPSVTVALAGVESSHFFRRLQHVPYEPGRGVWIYDVREDRHYYETVERYTDTVFKYWQECESLKQALNRSDYTPDRLLGGVDFLHIQRGNWDAMHGRRQERED